MYNLLISLLVSSVTASVVMLLGFPWISAVLPAVFVFPVVLFLLARRTSKQIEAALRPLPELMQAQKVDEVRALIRKTRDDFGRWQFLLTGQLTAQEGMIDYMQQRFDSALPKLQQGTGGDWMSGLAIACIHVRKGDLDAAWKAFADAASGAPKEARVYGMWAVVAARKGQSDRALEAVNQGLAKVDDSPMLKQLRSRIANKNKVDTSLLGDLWFQLFPEELAQRYMVRGQRNPPELPPGVSLPQGMQPRPQPRARGKLARRR